MSGSVIVLPCLRLNLTLNIFRSNNPQQRDVCTTTPEEYKQTTVTKGMNDGRARETKTRTREGNRRPTGHETEEWRRKVLSPFWLMAIFIESDKFPFDRPLLKDMHPDFY